MTEVGLLSRAVIVVVATLIVGMALGRAEVSDALYWGVIGYGLVMGLIGFLAGRSTCSPKSSGS